MSLEYWVARAIFRVGIQLTLLAICLGVWLWYVSYIPDPVVGPGVVLVEGNICMIQPNTVMTNNVTQWCQTNGATEYVRLSK
jgi:hypothetical protein